MGIAASDPGRCTTLQFRPEFVNVLNRTGFTAPDCDFTNAASAARTRPVRSNGR
jgi:hypothetical protein